jgi:hypothetical protein
MADAAFNAVGDDGINILDESIRILNAAKKQLVSY